MFAGWPQRLPSAVEICAISLPGRWMRFGEPPFTSLSPLADALVDNLTPYLDRQFVFFGHSMGALVCYEVTRRLQKQQKAQPIHFYASGCVAPHLPDPHPLHRLPDQEFVRELARYGGISEEILTNADLLELLLPVMRADATVTETYVHQAGALLACPITAVGGENDTLVTRRYVEAWQDHTASAFRLHMLKGDHFFLEKEKDVFLALFASELDALLP
jgi:medium-chain acyl-[acyl-carrier-protein] hydrolase